MSWKNPRSKHTMRVHAAAMLVVIFLASSLAGCGGAQPSLEPTVDTLPTFSLIQTQAAQTVVAELTLNAPTAAPIIPTNTPQPPTETYIRATETSTPEPTFTQAPPTPTPTNTFVPRTATPLPTATSSTYNCTITDSSPAYLADLRFGSDFDGKWVVKNTGSQTWLANEVDIRWIAGSKFQTRVDTLDLSKNVAKNESITIIIDMLAPKETGRYWTTWALVRGDSTICVLPLTIDVVQ